MPELMKRLLDDSMGDRSFLYFALTNRRSIIILGTQGGRQFIHLSLRTDPTLVSTWHSTIHFLSNRFISSILGALLMLPGCFSRSLARLSWPSFLTVCAITVAVVFVLISFFHRSECVWCDSYSTVVRPRHLWWSVQGVVCFCFTFQRVGRNVP